MFDMRISVVVPVLDDAAELAGCLRALREQTRPADEIVVVDNGCRDDSRSVAAAAGARIVDEPLRGIPAASAAGLDAATGDVLCRLDADSRPGPDWVARIVEHFAADPPPAAVTGPGHFLGLSRWRARAAGLLYMDAYFLSVGAAMAHPPLFGSNMAIGAGTWHSVRDRVHRRDPEVHDDIDLSFQLGAADRIVYDPALTVGVSARPFDDPAAMRRRFRRAFHTIAVNWRQAPPSRRWLDRITADRVTRREPPTAPTA